MGFDAKYEAPEKLHVTLAFLGFVPAAYCSQITSALGSIATRSNPFAVALDKLGAFPHERKPRVVYVGAREQGAPFRELSSSVRDAYAELGFDFKSDPVAHVTIARVKERTRPLPLIDVAPFTLEITTLTLFESLPDKKRNTSRYEVLARAPLRRHQAPSGA
jgi:RNA 2',3'-cyclic 3'-phosphodiesterase